MGQRNTGWQILYENRESPSNGWVNTGQFKLRYHYLLYDLTWETYAPTTSETFISYLLHGEKGELYLRDNLVIFHCFIVGSKNNKGEDKIYWYTYNGGAKTFSDRKNWRGWHFSWRKNAGPRTFCNKKNGVAKTFFVTENEEANNLLYILEKRGQHFSYLGRGTKTFSFYLHLVALLQEL